MTEMEPSSALIKVGDESTELKVILKEEAINVQKSKLLYMLVQLVIMFLLKVFVGSSSKPSAIGIVPCSGGFWVLSWLYVPICVVSCIILGKKVLKQYQLKQSLRFPF